MKLILIITLCLITANLFCQNANYEDDLFDNKIRKMLDIQGVQSNWNTLMTDLIKKQKINYPQIDSIFWQKFEKSIFEDSYNQFINMMTPIYGKYLNNSEVTSIIEFYESEAGKSFIEKTPQIIIESIKVGEELGKNIVSKIFKEINEENSKNFNIVNSGCSDIQTGKFKYIMPDTSTMMVERNEKYQFEYYKGTTTKYKIEWINECKYSLEVLKTDNALMQNNKNRVFITNIYKVTEGYYQYVCLIKGEDYKFDGKMYRVK